MRWIYFLCILFVIMAVSLSLISCTSGNHTLTSVCYKEKYNTILLDGARTIVKVVDDECYKNPEVLRWQFKRNF